MNVELTTCPMKGTTKRGLTDAEDLKEATVGTGSQNRSENMMIVTPCAMT